MAIPYFYFTVSGWTNAHLECKTIGNGKKKKNKASTDFTSPQVKNFFVLGECKFNLNIQQ